MSACPYCSEGHRSTEILGWQIHKFSDRWIACLVQDALVQSTELAQQSHPNVRMDKERLSWPGRPEKYPAAG